jgi:hypothetical protein
MRDPRPGLVGDRFRCHFGVSDGSFDSIGCDTALDQAIHDRLSSQRLDRFPDFSCLGQHLFWAVRHDDRLSGFDPRRKSDWLLGSTDPRNPQDCGREGPPDSLRPQAVGIRANRAGRTRITPVGLRSGP